MTTEPETSAPAKDWLVTVGLGVSAVSAAATSFDGLRSLAAAAGWTSAMAVLMPLCVDALSLTASRIWLSQTTSSTRARRFARNTAIGAIVLSLAGNAVWHLIAAQLLIVNWVIVVVVGAIPPLVLGLVSHLAVLRRQSEVIQVVPEVVPKDGEAVPTETETVPRVAEGGLGTPAPTPVRPRPSTDELLAIARDAAEKYKAEHGKHITRDELRRVLRIGGTKASEVLRQLRAEAS